MITLTAAETGPLMKALLLSETFDHFLFVEGEVKTFMTFSVSGRRNSLWDQENGEAAEDTTETSEAAPRPEFVEWKEAKPFFLQIMKGKRLPLSFSLTFSCPDSICGPDPEAAGRLFNLRFLRRQLFVTTGYTQKTFVPHHDAEHVWDEFVRRFLADNGFAFEE